MVKGVERVSKLVWGWKEWFEEVSARIYKEAEKRLWIERERSQSL